jgi:hypothetical protein
MNYRGISRISTLYKNRNKQGSYHSYRTSQSQAWHQNSYLPRLPIELPFTLVHKVVHTRVLSHLIVAKGSQHEQMCNWEIKAGLSQLIHNLQTKPTSNSKKNKIMKMGTLHLIYYLIKYTNNAKPFFFVRYVNKFYNDYFFFCFYHQFNLVRESAMA